MLRSTKWLVAGAVVVQMHTPARALGGSPPEAINVLEQDRAVFTFVIVPPCAPPDSDFDDDEAIDFGPFNSVVESIRDCDLAFGIASAQQVSSFGVVEMNAVGITDAQAFAVPNTVIHAIPSTQFSATFEIAVERDFEITGSLAASGAAPVVLSNAQVRLRNDVNEIMTEVLVQPGANGEEVVAQVNETGTLMPGTYTLMIDAVVGIDSTVPPGGDGHASFDIAFRIIIPGDLNRDGLVSELDSPLFCAALGSSEGEPNYDAAGDLNGDGEIDEQDLQLFNDIVRPCAGDVVTSATFLPPPDGVTDGADLAYLLGAWGDEPSCADMVTSRTFAPPPDGKVDGADLAYLLGAWGVCP